MTDWKEAVRKWRADELVQSVEMGGIGPGYEQTLQIMIFEIMAQWEGEPNWTFEDTKLPVEFKSHADKVIFGLDLGPSSAQAGAAINVAFSFMHYGYEHMLSKAPEDRRIFVCRKFPDLALRSQVASLRAALTNLLGGIDHWNDEIECTPVLIRELAEQARAALAGGGRE